MGKLTYLCDGCWKTTKKPNFKKNGFVLCGRCERKGKHMMPTIDTYKKLKMEVEE